MSLTIRPRRTTRPGWTPAEAAAGATPLPRELLVNVADARIWVVVGDRHIELFAADMDAQRDAVNAMDRGLMIRGA